MQKRGQAGKYFGVSKKSKIGVIKRKGENIQDALVVDNLFITMDMLKIFKEKPFEKVSCLKELASEDGYYMFNNNRLYIY